LQNWFRANSFFFSLFFALIAAYFPLLFSTENYSPDASIILPYLNSTSSLAGYWNDLINLKTIDFQPIRDLSLGLDLMILKKFGLKTLPVAQLDSLVLDDLDCRTPLKAHLSSDNNHTNLRGPWTFCPSSSV